MGSKAKILSIKQNIIVNKKKKTAKGGLTAFSSFVIVAILLVMSIESFGVSEIASTMSYVYNPVNSLYSDNSSLVFASGNAMKKWDFRVPVVTSKREVMSTGEVIFEVTNSIMVLATEEGSIENTGVTNDGVKFIQIMHTLDLVTRIENVDIIGVSVGDKVKRGQEIATAKLGDKVTMRIFDCGTLPKKINIEQSKITWEM